MKHRFSPLFALYLTLSLLFVPAVQGEAGLFTLNQSNSSEEVWSSFLTRDISFEFEVDPSSTSEVEIDLDSPASSSSRSLAPGESWIGNGRARTVTVVLENSTAVASGSWEITVTGDGNGAGAFGPASFVLIGLLLAGIIILVFLKRN